MKRIEDLVPKNKFDFSRIEELRMLSDEETVEEVKKFLDIF